MSDHPIHPGSIEDLKEFLSRFTLEESREAEPTRRIHGGHFHDIALHFRDLNREIVEEGVSGAVPEGAVGIRGDGDFWQVAHLPLRFRNLSCSDICRSIWPGVEDMIFLPDSDDYWWTAIHDEQLEVPGEPHELWLHHTYEDGGYERMRFGTYATLDETLDEARRRNTQGRFDWHILTWTDGVRSRLPAR